MTTRKYMAAPVPGYIRQTRLSHIPLDCVIGRRVTKASQGANLVFDIIMLPVQEFNRMKSNVGLSQELTPTLKLGGSVQFSYVLPEIKQITVPDDEPDPKAFAKAYFIKAFGITA